MQRKCKRDGRSAFMAGEGIEVSMERSNEADMTPVARGPQPGVRRDGGLCEEQKWVRVQVKEGGNLFRDLRCYAQ